jgi:uncharacterized membrane-anchored protein
MKAPSVKLPLLSRGKATEPPGIAAVARVDRRTKNITKRLNPGEIAIIDHSDLDRVSAEELIRRKVAAVVNASVSITGRYPNLGPKLLLDAGIPIVDGVGPDVLVKVTDGTVVRLDDAADRGAGAGGDDRGQGHDRGADRVVRREHARVPPA